ncbi:uncharacterized protein LOC131601102 isoform X2 [Vicia villosa]|uniref:uncharacterized protein LOC131601102 isoform X2 n=1 Tax=Vicia villosa TaxID=3911 RepID=UPI00273BAF98|nr:uncharacterized protein LOC131601102 isoform X2 [Vicia villosa]
MMRVRFLTSFIIVLCTQAISIFGLHQNFSLNSSNSNIELETNQSISINYGSLKEKKFEQAYDTIKRAHRGKGARGGEYNNERSKPRRSRNSAPSKLSRISTVISNFYCKNHKWSYGMPFCAF